MTFMVNSFCFLLVFVTTFVVVAWLLHYSRRNACTLPAGPWHIPLIGSLQLFTTASHIEVTKLCKKYGKMFTLYIGSDPLVVLNDLEIIKEALIEHADIFSDRFTFKAFERIINMKGSLVFENGPAWKARRRVVLAALHTLTSNKTCRQLDINKEADCFCQRFGEFDGKPFDPSHLISMAGSNIICSISYGRRFSYDDQMFRHVLTNLDKVVHCSFIESFLRTMPVISRIPGLNGFRKSVESILDFNLNMVREHKTSFDPSSIRDVIDAMLKEGQTERKQGADSNELVFTDELIARSLFDLFGAGTDTTANTLRWALLLMTQFPDIQAKVQQEIDDVIGCRGTPSTDDISFMPYTIATIMEVQRYRVPSPFVPPRRTQQDVNINGVNIPKGTQIWVNLWAVLHDPALWDKPETFDPTRFLADDGKRAVVPEAFIPFGAGRRICLGKKLANMQIFIFFTNIMQKFTVSWPQEGAVKADLKGYLGITLGPKNYKICAISRQDRS